MGEGAVNFVLSKLANVEPTSSWKTWEEIQCIADELTFMRAFLRKVDTKMDADIVVKAMVKRVRDIAHDVEDVLEEYKLHMSRDTKYGSCALLRSSVYWIENLVAQHRIASKVQGIRSELQSIGEQQRRYLIRKDIMEQNSLFETATIPAAGLPKADLGEEPNLVGVENSWRQLTEWLVDNEPECIVLPIVGMGGLGKTTLARMVYKDREVKMHFKFRAWITLTQSFNLGDLLRDLVQQLFTTDKLDLHEMEYMMSDELRSMLEEFLQKRKYLVVLDDVWHPDHWRMLEHALPRNNFGSRIMVTTRNADVAATCTLKFQYKIYQLNPLSHDESWALFRQQIFKGNSFPPHLREVSEKILHRCEGLPLAIVSISGILAGKADRVDEWEAVYRELGKELDNDSILTHTGRILLLSYHDLPYHLRSCLLYFSIFPERTHIKRMRLVRLWMAEGFVEERRGTTTEEVAQQYLDELVRRSLVQVEMSTDGTIRACRIHSLLREVIVSKSRELEFAATVTETDLTLPDRLRRIHLHALTPRVQKKLASVRLFSLFVSFDADSFSPPPSLNLLHSHIKLLTVLDMEGTSIDKFPKEITRLLLLKYLSLRRTRVESIPRSIGNLKVLETLDLKHARVTELPAEILKLQKLRHLLVYRYSFEVSIRMNDKSGFKSPAEIGNLESMQKLCYVEANSKMVVELRRLLQLRRLGIIKLQKADGPALCSSIENLTNLLALSVTAIDGVEIIDMEQLSHPPPFLQRLYLNGRLEKLPNWISTARNLVKMILRWSKLGDDPLQVLQHLPNLIHLEMVQTYKGERMSVQAKGFQKLKFLGLNGMEKLRIIILEKGAMPFLGKLILQDCPSLERLPYGIEKLGELKVLDLFNMPEKLIRRLQYNGEDQNAIRHVPEVYLTRWNQGRWDAVSLAASPKKGSNPIKRDAYLWKP